MSTHSHIGIKTEDGNIRSIYCHNEGGVDGVGKTLNEHYTSPEKINALMDLGSVFNIRSEIGEKHSCGERGKFEALKQPNQIWNNWTLAYHRDRGDALKQNNHKGMHDFVQGALNSWAEFVYLWDNGEWLFSKNPHGVLYCNETMNSVKLSLEKQQQE